MKGLNRSKDKNHYITEQFEIGKFLKKKTKRARSRENKIKQNLYEKLYDDAFKRKSRQEERENEIYHNQQDQSIRSFLKQSNKSLIYNHSHTKSTRTFKKPSGEKPSLKAQISTKQLKKN